jgi:perosamine synthetase
MLAVDAFGRPASLDEIRDVARKYGLVLIEDSCESPGSVHKGEGIRGTWPAGFMQAVRDESAFSGKAGVACSTEK